LLGAKCLSFKLGINLKREWIGVVSSLIAYTAKIMSHRVIPDLFKAAPAAHGRVESVLHDIAKRFQTFDEAAFAGTVVADEDGQRAERHRAAVADSLEILQAEAAERQFHRM